VTTATYTLSLHDALPIFGDLRQIHSSAERWSVTREQNRANRRILIAVFDRAHQNVAEFGIQRIAFLRPIQREAQHAARAGDFERSEEHTSELQSRGHLVC